MNYIEQVRQLANEKGLDPDKVEEDLITAALAKVEEDLITAALAMNGSAQEIARAFVIAEKLQCSILPVLLTPGLELE
jgi:hypothetical protein